MSAWWSEHRLRQDRGRPALAIAATHGDAPHAVLAPTTIRDCFEIMILAFDIADKYQLPVIVLSEQALGFRRADLPKSLLRDAQRAVVPPVPPNLVEGARYLRYQLTESGVSPRAVPGMKARYHVATGLSTLEIASRRTIRRDGR
jgi:2-oxoglutarate ferredoxin oxidoreductase subunit alpha